VCGLAQVVQRLNASTPLRYLSETDLAGISHQAADRYRELARIPTASVPVGQPER
jgi:hypothetical protein